MDIVKLGDGLYCLSCAYIDNLFFLELAQNRQRARFLEKYFRWRSYD